MKPISLLSAFGISVFLVVVLMVSNFAVAGPETLLSTHPFSGVSVLPVFHGGHGGGGHFGGHAGGHYAGGAHHGGGFHHSGRGMYRNRGNYIRHPGGFFWSDIEVDGYPCVWNGYRYKCYDVDDDDYDYINGPRKKDSG
ncbi:MAG: hypothetical protein ACP5U1_13810, partial [Desulfomonilaceae bacterium]